MAGNAAPPAPATNRKRVVLLAAAACGLALVLGLALGKSGRQQSHQHQQPASNVVIPDSPELPSAEDKAVAGTSASTTESPASTSSASSLVPTTTTTGISTTSTSPVVSTGPVTSAVGTLWSSLTSALTGNNKQGLNDPYLGTADPTEASFLAVPLCTPRNTTELEIMVEETACPVITLLPNTTYALDHYITVSRPVTIVGRPLSMPTLDGHGTFRIFMVLPGGRLDLRYVRLYKGRARPVVPDLLYVLQGAILYVRRGGAAAMTGCHVTIHPSTRYANVGISRNPQATTLILGGGIYVEGGIFRATGCVYTSWRPGIIYRETYFIGNEFLVLTGDVFITGCIFSAVQIFADTIGLGGFVFNVAGTVAFTGCVFNANTMFLQASGVGYLIFNGGGLAILTGNINNLQLGFAAFFGGGLGVFNGGGVTTMTGMISNAEGIMSAGLGLGFQAGCGGGVVIRTGILQSVHGAASFGCGVGHSQFLGSGVVVFTNVALTRTTMIAAFFGIGGYLYVGAGSATITNTVAGVVTGIGTTAAAGGGTMILAGWLVRTNNLVLGQSMIVAVFGQGTDLMVAAGGAVLTFNRVVTRRPALIYANPGIYGIWVAGNGIFFRPRIDKVVVATKAGQWKGFKNVTEKGMAKFSHMSWRFIPRKIKLKKESSLAPSSQPPPPPPPPEDAAFYIGVPFFGIRRRQRGRRLNEAETSGDNGMIASFSSRLPRSNPRLLPSSSTPMASMTTRTMKLPSAALIAQAVGQLLTLDDAAASSASSYAGLFGGSSTPAEGEPVEMGAILDEDEDEDRTLPLTTVVTTVGEDGQQHEQQVQQNSYFYVGDDKDALGSCEACDVQQETEFDGPGAGKCVMRASCEEEEEEEDGRWGGVRKGLLKQMWMTGPGQDPANTSLAVLDLRVTASSLLPSSTASAPAENSSSRRLGISSIDTTHVLGALNETIQALGLSPRFHLRVIPVASDPLMKKYQHAEMEERCHHRDRLRALVNKPGVIEGEDYEEEKDEAEEEGTFLFRAYLVSDWANVTNDLSRGLAENAKLLTTTLQRQQQQQEEEGVGGIQAVQVLKAMNFFVPGTGTGVLLAPSTISSPSSSSSFSASSIPLLSSLFGGGSNSDSSSGVGKGKFMTMSGWEEDNIPSAMLYTSFTSAPFRNSTTSSSSSRDGAVGGAGSTEFYEEDGASALVQEAKVGETYTLVLHSFPPSQLLTIRLLPETGLGTTLAVIASTAGEEGGGDEGKEEEEDGGQRWTWPPSALIGLKAGEEEEYFIEVTSQNQDAFAYSQAFTLRG